MVIRWQITKRNIFKQGLLAFFGLKIINNQLNLTETQQKLNHEYRLNQLISAGFQRKTSRKQFSIKTETTSKRISPILVNYEYSPVIAHNFSTQKTAIVALNVSIQNLLQTSDCGFDVHLAAENDQNELKT